MTQYVVGSGVTSTGLTLQDGDSVSVLSGGITSGTVVSFGGHESAYSGTLISSFVSGQENLYSGSVAIDATIYFGGYENVISGTTSGALIEGGATVYPDSVADNATVNSGGLLYVHGIANDSVVASGGLTVANGGTAHEAVVSQGGFIIVSNGGTLDDALIQSGATLILLSGSESNDVTVQSGALVYEPGDALVIANEQVSGWETGYYAIPSFTVENGGTAIDTLVGPGGSATVSSGGTMISTIIQQTDSVAVLNGGVVSTTVVDGTLTISDGASAVSAAVGFEGRMFVTIGGFASDVSVSSGGELTVLGGSAFNTTVAGFKTPESHISSFEYLSSGAIQSGGTVGVNGQIIAMNSVVEDMTVESGGFITLSRGGAANHLDVKNGGVVAVDIGGGTPTDITIHNGGRLYLADVFYDDSTTAIFDPTTDQLSLYELGSLDATVQLSGDYTGEFFHLSEANFTGYYSTLITVDTTPPCYCRGTLILTDRGEIPVEHLRIGDHVVTFSGAVRPIRWIGQRSYDGRFAASNRDVLPVLIRAGALADGVPRRDLSVSPLHAMFLDDALVPAAALVNGVSITRMPNVEQVEYFHIELETHDVILAEGAPAETFADEDGRLIFHNAAEYAVLYPDAAPQPARYCAPRLEDGPALEALRHRIAARCAPPQATPGPLLGELEMVSRGQIRGWAHDVVNSDPVLLQITHNGAVFGQVVAEIERADLALAGIGEGRCGFVLTIPGGLSPLESHTLEVRRVSDGQALQRSPWVFAPAHERRVA